MTDPVILSKAKDLEYQNPLILRIIKQPYVIAGILNPEEKCPVVTVEIYKKVLTQKSDSFIITLTSPGTSSQKDLE